MYPTILGTSLISDLVGGSVSEGLQWILNNTIFRLLYWIAAAGCWVIGILYSMFEVMAGLVKVTYDGQKQYLINIFFGNSAVNKVYWGNCHLRHQYGAGKLGDSLHRGTESVESFDIRNPWIQRGFSALRRRGRPAFVTYSQNL